MTNKVEEFESLLTPMLDDVYHCVDSVIFDTVNQELSAFSFAIIVEYEYTYPNPNGEPFKHREYEFFGFEEGFSLEDLQKSEECPDFLKAIDSDHHYTTVTKDLSQPGRGVSVTVRVYND